MDFHPQVVKAKMNCSGQTNYTMFLLHMWKSAGWASMENLERVANSYTMVEAFEDDYAALLGDFSAIGKYQHFFQFKKSRHAGGGITS
jgi:hypothetical protein